VHPMGRFSIRLVRCESEMPGPVHEGPDIAAEIFVLEAEDAAG
jgi:hypothetical protein